MRGPGKSRIAIRSHVRLKEALLAAYVVLCILAQTWPGYALLGNSIQPYLFGLPWSLAWVVGWVLATFVVLVLYHAASERKAG